LIFLDKPLLHSFVESNVSAVNAAWLLG